MLLLGPLLLVAAGGFAICAGRVLAAMAAFEHDLFDDLDVYCPLCDGTDLDDWGEPGWWSCRPCAYLFEMKEPLR